MTPLPRALALAAMMAASPAAAQDRPGDFDYYVLALSWNPTWCATEGADRDAAHCAPGAGRAFTVHGLWPQRERGWPQDCRTDARGPTRRQTAAMADLMGSGGLAWAQWRKHGRCSGLDGSAYLALTRAAAETVRIPPGLSAAGRDARMAPAAVEAAFLRANPGLSADGVTVLCRDGLLREVRVCLTRALAPRDCAPDARRDCRARAITLPAAP